MCKLFFSFSETPFVFVVWQWSKYHFNCLFLFVFQYHIKKPHARMMSRHNDISPFENCVPLEMLANKFDSSMFMFASHNKKRPNNLVLGRLNDHHVLDMIELGLVSYQGMSTFKNEKVSFGIKPCLLFAGDLFESNLDYSRLQNLLVDLFQRQKVEKIRLQGLEHVIMFTATDNNKILMRSYKINLKKSGVKTPLVELEEIGPRADFIVRRSQIASEDLYRMAFKKPKILKVIFTILYDFIYLLDTLYSYIIRHSKISIIICTLYLVGNEKKKKKRT